MEFFSQKPPDFHVSWGIISREYLVTNSRCFKPGSKVHGNTKRSNTMYLETVSFGFSVTESQFQRCPVCLMHLSPRA